MSQSTESKQAQYITIAISAIFGGDGVNTPAPKMCNDGVERFILKTPDITVLPEEGSDDRPRIEEGTTLFLDVTEANAQFIEYICDLLEKAKADGRSAVEVDYKPTV
jgi:hypothetical protein